MDRRYDTWEKIRDELRRLRGLNLFRGREEHVLPKGQVRIPIEARGSDRSNQGEIIIYLSKVESELHAIAYPGKEKVKLEDCGMDIGLFMERIAAMARGESYLHTNSKSANYRKPT